MQESRRRVLRLVGGASLVGLAGCTGVLNNNDGYDPSEEDSDDDGVVDTEDYAPWDDSVQDKSDVTETTPSAEDTTTMGNEGAIIDDFEDGDLEEWRIQEGRDPELLSLTEDAVQGNYAGQLAFGAHVWRPFQRSAPSELRFWFRTGAVDDNELNFVFLDASGQEWASLDVAAFGIELGAENRQGVVLNPPFPNGEQYPVLYEQPEVDTWYQVRFSNIDFEAGRFDATLHDESGSELGRVGGHRIANDSTAINQLQINNSMNYSEATAAIDQLERL